MEIAENSGAVADEFTIESFDKYFFHANRCQFNTAIELPTYCHKHTFEMIVS
jgi:hypothetical protein